MKTKFIYKITMLLISLLVFSCSEEFLDRKPIATNDEISFYNSMASVDMATTACYSMFNIEKVWDLSVMMTMGSIASDEAECGAGGKADVPEFQAIDQFRHNPGTPRVFEWTYGYFYRAIGYCNVAIEKFPLIDPTLDPNYSEEIVLQRTGEARFIRAINYFTLCQIFGGVPLVDHVLLPTETAIPRAEIPEIYALIKSDLHEAIDLLPVRSELGSENGRASKGAAQALLAKVYLYESSYAKYCNDDYRFDGMIEHWDSALYWSEQVIGSDEYKLIGIDGETFDTYNGLTTPGYQYVFMNQANNSKEEVFSIQSRMDNLGSIKSRGNGLTNWCGARQIILPNGNASGFGWGWWCPTDFLVNAYETGDPRYKATVLEETDSIYYGKNGSNEWAYPDFSILEEGTGLHRATRKYQASRDEFWDVKTDWNEGPVNVKIIRYADVVLFAAEAAFELGQQAKAVDYVNLVRLRARNGETTGAPANITAVTHDVIVKERLVELALEGHRFWDLVRWNEASKYLNNHVLADGDVITYQKKLHEFFPLPAFEVSQSGGIIEQYPGW